MMYYTSHPGAVNPENERVKFIKENNIGLMISAAAWQNPFCHYALDNGAFTDYLYNRPFNSDRFLKTLQKTDELPIKPDFIIIPDIVGGGVESFNLSKQYLYLSENYQSYFSVQNGMTPEMVEDVAGENIIGLFVGGTTTWKWRNLHIWVHLARAYGLKIHVGKVGTLENFQRCAGAGVDSADGSNLVRHGKLHKIPEFLRIVNEAQVRFA